MKKNNKGFMLTEILIVVTVIVTAMIFLYSQISNITRNYEKTFKYNNVNGIYAAKNIKEFLTDDNINNIVFELNNQEYIDLSNCSSSYIINTSYCIMLYDNLNIKTVYFTKENALNLTNLNIDSEMKKFIKTIKFEDNEQYRLIVEYNDETFASIKMEV